MGETHSAVRRLKLWKSIQCITVFRRPSVLDSEPSTYKHKIKTATWCNYEKQRWALCSRGNISSRKVIINWHSRIIFNRATKDNDTSNTPETDPDPNSPCYLHIMFWVVLHCTAPGSFPCSSLCPPGLCEWLQSVSFYHWWPGPETSAPSWSTCPSPPWRWTGCHGPALHTGLFSPV